MEQYEDGYQVGQVRYPNIDQSAYVSAIEDAATECLYVPSKRKMFMAAEGR